MKKRMGRSRQSNKEIQKYSDMGQWGQTFLKTNNCNGKQTTSTWKFQWPDDEDVVIEVGKKQNSSSVRSSGSESKNIVVTSASKNSPKPKKFGRNKTDSDNSKATTEKVKKTDLKPDSWTTHDHELINAVSFTNSYGTTSLKSVLKKDANHDQEFYVEGMLNKRQCKFLTKGSRRTHRSLKLKENNSKRYGDLKKFLSDCVEDYNHNGLDYEKFLSGYDYTSYNNTLATNALTSYNTFTTTADYYVHPDYNNDFFDFTINAPRDIEFKNTNVIKALRQASASGSSKNHSSSSAAGSPKKNHVNKPAPMRKVKTQKRSFMTLRENQELARMKQLEECNRMMAEDRLAREDEELMWAIEEFNKLWQKEYDNCFFNVSFDEDMQVYHVEWSSNETCTRCNCCTGTCTCPCCKNSTEVNSFNNNNNDLHLNDIKLEFGDFQSYEGPQVCADLFKSVSAATFTDAELANLDFDYCRMEKNVVDGIPEPVFEEKEDFLMYDLFGDDLTYVGYVNADDDDFLNQYDLFGEDLWEDCVESKDVGCNTMSCPSTTTSVAASSTVDAASSTLDVEEFLIDWLNMNDNSDGVYIEMTDMSNQKSMSTQTCQTQEKKTSTAKMTSTTTQTDEDEEECDWEFLF